MGKDTKYRVLVVDDEFLARKLLCEYIQKIPSLELVGSVSNAVEAFALLQRQPVDLLFLDIQMPDISGLELAYNLKNGPAIIFTTAYSEHALESYELHTVDYLLKPIAFPRFFTAVNKAIERLGTVAAVSEKQEPSGSRLTTLTQDYLLVKADHKIYKINYSDLVYIEGQREYVTFHTLNNRITAYYTLKNLEEQLPSDRFLRIHKSYIVSFHYIETLEGNVVTIAGEKLPIGGSYRDILLEKLDPK